MLFENDRLPLETILGAIQHFTWIQAWYLASKLTFFLSYMGVSLTPDFDFEGLVATENIINLSVPKTEKIPLDRLEVAIALLNQDELLALRDALREVIRHKKPAITWPKNTTGAVRAMTFSASALYPERDYSALMAAIPEAQKQANELLSQAHQEKRNENMEKCSELINQAVRVMEQSGLPSFQIRITRESILAEGNSPDDSKIAAIMEEELAFYRQKGDVDKFMSSLAQISSRVMHEDTARALSLIDEGMQLAEQHNQPTFLWKRLRYNVNRHGKPHDPTFLREDILIFEEELAYYQQQNDLQNIVQTLLNLSSAASQLDDKPQALHYLQEADNLLKNITESDIQRSSQTSPSMFSPYQIKSLFQLEAVRVEQQRKHLLSDDNKGHTILRIID